MAPPKKIKHRGKVYVLAEEEVPPSPFSKIFSKITWINSVLGEVLKNKGGYASGEKMIEVTLEALREFKKHRVKYAIAGAVAPYVERWSKKFNVPTERLMKVMSAGKV